MGNGRGGGKGGPVRTTGEPGASVGMGMGDLGPVTFARTNHESGRLYAVAQGIDGDWYVAVGSGGEVGPTSGVIQQRYATEAEARAYVAEHGTDRPSVTAINRRRQGTISGGLRRGVAPGADPTRARLAIRAKVYRGEAGFTVGGTDAYGRSGISIWTSTRASAEKMRDLLRRGWDVRLSDWPGQK